MTSHENKEYEHAESNVSSTAESNAESSVTAQKILFRSFFRFIAISFILVSLLFAVLDSLAKMSIEFSGGQVQYALILLKSCSVSRQSDSSIVN